MQPFLQTHKKETLTFFFLNKRREMELNIRHPITILLALGC